MNKKYIWISLWILLIIVGFFFYKNSNKTNSVDSWSGSLKKEFYIDVTPLSEFSTWAFLEKNGKVTSTEEIKLSSQAMGRISLINVKEGDKVKKWQILMSLQDNIGSYWINLERARNWLQRTQLSYDSTKLQLDEQIRQQEISLEKLWNNLNTLKKNAEIDINQIKNDVADTDYTNLDSASALQLQKLDTSIAKAEFDYQNALNSNQETIDSFKVNLKNSYDGLDTFTQDIIDFWDKIFAITGKYEDTLSIKYESYLGWKDKTQRDQTKQALVDLIAYKKWPFQSIKIDSLDETTIKAALPDIIKWYELSKKFLDSFEDTIALSIPSIGILSEAELSAYNSTINAYQSQLQAQNAAYATFNNSAGTFLRTYKNNESSWKKQLDLLKQEREILLKTLTTSWTKTENALEKTQTSLWDGITSLELQIKSLESSLANARDSRDITLLTLQNGIKESQISYESAAKEYAKLTISAPIDGIVGDILIDKWQDVSNGTPLVSILWNKKSEIEITFKNDELSLVAVGDKVTFDLNEKPMVGTIYSITKVTDNNFNYKANVIFDTQFDTIGWVVKVKLPIKVKYPLLPMNIVTVVGNNEW
jgi:multidrug resistance efflux pump